MRYVNVPKSAYLAGYVGVTAATKPTYKQDIDFIAAAPRRVQCCSVLTHTNRQLSRQNIDIYYSSSLPFVVFFKSACFSDDSQWFK